jgi:LPS export ABC transporter protein LptC
MLILALMSACTSDIEKVQELGDAQAVPSLKIVNVNGKHTEKGQMRELYAAPLLLQYNFAAEKHTDFPEGIELYRYTDSMTLEASILANSAVYHEYKDLWEATGKVRIRNSKGEYLETEKLYWDTKEHRIYTDVWVRITTPDAIINGEGLTSNESFTDWEVLKISNSYIYVEDKKDDAK